MKFSPTSAAVVIACGLGLVASPARTFGQIVVSGYTYEFQGVNYTVLPNVQIQVFRRGSPILGQPVSSGHDGAFTLVISGPEPFDVVFFGPAGGPAKLPEMYHLAGKNGTSNQLHVTVYTIAQARKLALNPKAKIEYILPRIGAEAKITVPALAELLKDKELGSRTTAVQALGDIGPEARAAVPAIAELLREEDAPIRWLAASALGQIGPAAKTAVFPLTVSLKDDNERVRSKAAGALGKIGPEAKVAVPALTELLADHDDKVRAAAAEALERIKKGKK
ncbi:MAG: HEAT repeat domain-containing protein [Thermoguttaceae bacterium]